MPNPPEIKVTSRELGRTGMSAAEIGAEVWLKENADETAALEALAAAFELGANFVDTADVYGDGLSERLVGQAIRVSPKRILVATKAGLVWRQDQPPERNFSPQYLAEACER